MTKKLLILGTGGMAHSHVKAFQALPEIEVVACADVNLDAARAFAKEFGIPHHFGSLKDAIDAGGLDAAINSTPDAVHYATTMDLLQARIHVFCEKPLATNYAHAVAMSDAAHGAGLINGVNLTYRNVAALQKARELVAEGAIGAIKHIEASYLQSWLTQPAWGDWTTEKQWLWRLSKSHGSHGVLGDVGIHILDFASYATGADITALTCQLKTFEKAPNNKIGEYTLDANDSFAMTAEMTNGSVGVIHATRFATGHLNDLSLKIFGNKGGLQITNSGDLGTLSICAGDNLPTTWTPVLLSPVTSTYAKFAQALNGGPNMEPDFATAAKLQSVLDAAVTSDQTKRRVDIS